MGLCGNFTQDRLALLFLGFAHMFIPLLSIFFSFLLGIAAVLGFTSICTSIVSVDCFYKERFFISFLFVSTVPTGNVFLLQQILSLCNEVNVMGL